MKNLLRAAAISVASTALVAGGATVATAAPSTPTATVVASGDVSAAVAPYPLVNSKFLASKRGSKIKFKVFARYRDDAGNVVAIRRAKLQVAKDGRWKTLKNVRLNSRGKGTYQRTERKKRTYRVIIKPTAVYQGGYSKIRI